MYICLQNDALKFNFLIFYQHYAFDTIFPYCAIFRLFRVKLFLISGTYLSGLNLIHILLSPCLLQRFSKEKRSGQEWSQTINWSELVAAAEVAQGQPSKYLTRCRLVC